MRYPTAAAATAATAATGRSGRERCRETDVQAEDLAKEKAQLVVQGTTILHLWQIGFNLYLHCYNWWGGGAKL